MCIRDRDRGLQSRKNPENPGVSWTQAPGYRDGTWALDVAAKDAYATGAACVAPANASEASGWRSRTAAHHDACAHASARSHLPKKVLGNCLKYRMRGIPAYNAKDARNFWNNGGLSEAITPTLGRFVCRAGDT